jgi:hypothetical protein
MAEAVIKTDQYEIRILELKPEYMKVSVKDTYGESSNFVPRFASMVYPERTINAKDTGILVVRPKDTIEATIQFQEKLVLERFNEMEFRYARRKLATIVIE